MFSHIKQLEFSDKQTCHRSDSVEGGGAAGGDGKHHERGTSLRRHNIIIRRMCWVNPSETLSSVSLHEKKYCRSYSHWWIPSAPTRQLSWQRTDRMPGTEPAWMLSRGWDSESHPDTGIIRFSSSIRNTSRQVSIPRVLQEDLGLFLCALRPSPNTTPAGSRLLPGTGPYCFWWRMFSAVNVGEICWDLTLLQHISVFVIRSNNCHGSWPIDLFPARYQWLRIPRCEKSFLHSAVKVHHHSKDLKLESKCIFLCVKLRRGTNQFCKDRSRQGLSIFTGSLDLGWALSWDGGAQEGEAEVRSQGLRGPRPDADDSWKEAADPHNQTGRLSTYAWLWELR